MVYLTKKSEFSILLKKNSGFDKYIILSSKTKNIFKVNNLLKWLIFNYQNWKILYIKGFEEENKSLKQKINN